MEKVRSQQEGTGTESGPTLATDTEGREPGGQVSRSSPNAESRNDDALLSSGNKVFAQHHQHGPPESAEQRIRADSSPRGSSSSSKMKNRGLPAIDLSAGQGDSTVHPAAAPGMLPPLNIRGDTSRDIRDSRANSTISFKTAATTVMSAGTMRNFRRSSDAMHVDLLRVFVPDMLINVSGIDVYRCPCSLLVVVCSAAPRTEYLHRKYVSLFVKPKPTWCNAVLLSTTA